MNDHADTLRVLRAMRDDYECHESLGDQHAALDAAIAALEAGRSAEPVAYIERYTNEYGVACAGLVWADHPHDTPGRTFDPLYAAAPQQPTPVGMLRGIVEALSSPLPSSTPDEVRFGWATAKKIAQIALDQQPAPSVCCRSNPCKRPGVGPCDMPAPVSEPAASGEGYRSDALDIADEDAALEGDDDEGPSREGWRDIAQANIGVLDEIRALVGLEGKPGNVVEAVRRLTTTGQGDVERLVEALRECEAAMPTGALYADARRLACEALRPFQQQEGQG